jgi:hypothetical protein
MALVIIFILIAALIASLLYLSSYARALRSVIHGIEYTETKIARAVKNKVKMQAVADGTESFLNRIVKDETTI